MDEAPKKRCFVHLCPVFKLGLKMQPAVLCRTFQPCTTALASLSVGCYV